MDKVVRKMRISSAKIINLQIGGERTVTFIGKYPSKYTNEDETRWAFVGEHEEILAEAIDKDISVDLLIYRHRKIDDKNKARFVDIVEGVKLLY